MSLAEIRAAILTSPLLNAKTMDEFKTMVSENPQYHNGDIDVNADRIYREVAQILFSTNPDKKGSKLTPHGNFYTVTVQRLLWPQTKAVLEMIALGATEDEIKEILVECAKKLIY